MYYLKGILEQSKGSDAASKQAFSSAIRIKPDLQWNNTFAPDAQPVFDSAKEEFSNFESCPLTPSSKRQRRACGSMEPPRRCRQPIDLRRNQHYSDCGLETTTYEITVPRRCRWCTFSPTLTLPNTAYTWTSDPEKGSQLSEVLSVVRQEEASVYVHDSGKVWTSDLSQANWTNLEVPNLPKLD